MATSTEPEDRRALLGAVRATTIRRIADLQRSFEGIVEATDGVATDDEHDPEGHTIAWERQQVAALLAEARASLADIDNAVRRLDDGRYGTCTSCGRQIAPERLDALPASPVCVDCAG